MAAVCCTNSLFFYFTQALLPQHRAPGCALQFDGVDAYVHERCVSQDIRNNTDPPCAMRLILKSIQCVQHSHKVCVCEHSARQGMLPIDDYVHERYFAAPSVPAVVLRLTPVEEGGGNSGCIAADGTLGGQQ